MTRLKSGEVWHKLAIRLGLVDYGLDRDREVVDTIQPVTNVDELVARYVIETKLLDLTPGAGVLVAVSTVPTGERWFIKIGYKDATTGTCRLAITGINLTAAAAAEQVLICGQEVPVNEGSEIGGISGGNGADGSSRVSFLVRKEKRV